MGCPLVEACNNCNYCRYQINFFHTVLPLYDSTFITTVEVIVFSLPIMVLSTGVKNDISADMFTVMSPDVGSFGAL